MLFKSIVIVLTVLSIASMNPVACLGGEIVVRLTGKTDFPGDLSLKIKSIQLERLCFLGVGAKGKLDEKFLGSIENEGVPVGDYQVAAPLAEEQWPVPSFRKSGVLRLKMISGSGLEMLRGLKLNGIAIHGRDFYPLLERVVKNKQMINFHNNLLFERFLNPERVSMPDFDIDFCYLRRDEMIQYSYDKYGQENVSQIITFGRMLAKNVVRNVGRVLGMPYSEVDRLAKLIPD
ncbi:MAG TPA: hypothetical protein EYQ03_07495, partial [Nitrospinaceae bacterium]|nr:hypothetical protein [Nitrospinaceae bacterium]